MNGTNGEHASDDVEELRASLFKKEAECAQLSFDKARLRSIINALNAQVSVHELYLWQPQLYLLGKSTLAFL